MMIRLLTSSIRMVFVVLLFIAAFFLNAYTGRLNGSTYGVSFSNSAHEAEGSQAAISILAFGDVNLGRAVGQHIVEGDTNYPFLRLNGITRNIDVVIANLESQLSDQNGETQDPNHNLIFTGPPGGAQSLREFGITLVSTANNHAFDYGREALLETLDHLDGANIGHVGTTRSETTLYEPLMFAKNGFKIAFFAVTELMNFQKGWQGHVAMADTHRLFPKIREVRKRADIVILSYHGGDEYAAAPSKRIQIFAENAIKNGTTIFLGHHPHVPFGIQRFEQGLVFHSLGNLVFYQPQRDWCQRSFAPLITLTKTTSTVIIDSVRCLPIIAGYQPAIQKDSMEIEILKQRMLSLSNIPIHFINSGIIH